MHAAQQAQAGGVGAGRAERLGCFRLGCGGDFRQSPQVRLHRRAEAAPARQADAALAPGESPGDGAQVFDGAGGLARGRARADVELGDLAQGGGGEEPVGKAGGVVDDAAVGGEGGFAERGGCLQEGLRCGAGGVQQRGLQRGGHQRLQVAPADLGMGVLGADDLALLGQADLPAHGARRLRQDGLVAGPAAAADRAAAAVEQPQPDAMAGLELIEQAHQRDLGAVQLPVAGEEAAVLVAVAVAEHDVLLAAAGGHHRRDAGQGVVVAHDGFGAPQVTDGLEQRHDDQLGAGRRAVGRQGAVQQAAFLHQQQHLEQVTRLLGVGDDGVAQGLRAVAAAQFTRGLEDGQFAEAVLAVVGLAHPQRPHLAQQPHQQRALGRFVQGGVVGLDPGHAQQLRHHRLMAVGALADVQRGQVKTEHLHRAPQRRQPRPDQRLRVVVAQAFGDHVQVGDEGLGVGVGVLRRHGVAQRLGAGQLVQRRGQAGVDAGQGTPIGLVLAVRAVVRRGVGQRLHGRGDGRPGLRHRQLTAQMVHFLQVKAQRHLALPRQRAPHGGRADVGVAVAVAADPVAHAQEGRDGMAGQRLLDLGVQPWNLAQEGGGVVAQRVLDLVIHRQLGGAHHARLPQLGDAGADPPFVVGALARRDQAVARGHQLRDGALGVQDALALHLGGVGGQHGRDQRTAQQGGDVDGAHVGAVQPLQRQGDGALLHVAQHLVVAVAPHVVAVFGDVGQVREIAEGADHAHRLLGGQVLQQAVQRAAGAAVLAGAEGHGELAHALHEIEGVGALQLADGVAQDATQQPDVLAQRVVLVGVRTLRALREGSGGRGGGRRARRRGRR